MDSYIVFDLETTGLSPIANEITEIGAWKIEKGVAIEKFHTLVKPRGYYGRDVQALTGITLDMLQDACSIEEVLPSFISFCEGYSLLGHSLRFDYDFVCAKARPMGYDFSMQKRRQGIDTLELCRKYFPNRSHKLSDMAQFFEINLQAKEGFHRALYDAYITKLIYDRFVEKFSSLPDIIIPKRIEGEKTLYGKAVSNETLSFE